MSPSNGSTTPMQLLILLLLLLLLLQILRAACAEVDGVGLFTPESMASSSSMLEMIQGVGGT